MVKLKKYSVIIFSFFTIWINKHIDPKKLMKLSQSNLCDNKIFIQSGIYTLL